MALVGLPSIPALLAFQAELVLGAGLLLVLLSLSMIARRRRAKRPPAPSPGERLETLRQRQGVRDDLERLAVEIEQLAKRLGHQLDAKAVRLERLIDEADERLAALDGRLDEGADAGDPSVRHEGPEPATERDPPLVPEPAAPVDPLETSAPTSPRDRLAKEVYALADGGATAAQIADRLDEHPGKIEVLLALRAT